MGDEQINKRGAIRVSCAILGGILGAVLGFLFLLEPETKLVFPKDNSLYSLRQPEYKETGRKKGWPLVLFATVGGGALGYKLGDEVANEILK